jgi:hypothetical protein
MYIAGRQLDLDQPLRGGDVEYSGGYISDRDEIERRVAELNGQVPLNLKGIPTCDLVKELAAREGVTEYVAGPQDRYLVRTKTDDGISRVDFDLGPAVILVVVD